MRKAIQSLVILGSLLVGSAAYAQDTAEIQKAVDGLSDVFAKDVALRWKWKGDFRVRNENIEQEFSADRNRSRVRVRLGFEAEVNPTVKAGFQFATTENGDARSSNQTLGDVNSRKSPSTDACIALILSNIASLSIIDGVAFDVFKISPGRAFLFLNVSRNVLINIPTSFLSCPIS